MAHSQLDAFSFEGLDVYRVAYGALKIVLGHRSRLRGLPGEIASQMERAAVSTVSNLCEATGRAGKADRRQRFAIARGEANEVGSMMESRSSMASSTTRSIAS